MGNTFSTSDSDGTTPLGFTRIPEIREIMARCEPESFYGSKNDGGFGNIVRFQQLPAEDAARLLELLPDFQKRDKQNDAPTFQEFVELGQRFPGMTFHGYRVTPERSDERITIEGFYMPMAGLSPEALEELRALDADECDIIEDPNGNYLRAWWD